MLKGFYRDILKKSGSILSDSGWCSNHIVAPCDTLISALFKEQSGYGGIAYLAIGTGERAWDFIDEKVSPDTTMLKNESTRYPLRKEVIRYIDRSGGFSITPTDTVQVDCTITVGNQKSLSLREFGLFGGTATDLPDSGQMIDYVIHPRISLTPGFTLERTIVLRFSNAGNTAPVLISPGEPPPIVTGNSGRLLALPLEAIDGIGRKYRDDLNKSEITTLQELAECDPSKYTGSVPLAHLNAFRSKAAFSKRIVVDPVILKPFESMTVQDFINMKLETSTANIPDNIDRERLRKQQLEIALLESSFNTKKLETLLIRELLPD